MTIPSISIAGLGARNYGDSIYITEEFHAVKHLSARLGEFLGQRPHPQCHAHAIVSGGHPRAAQTRAISARLKMCIDDPHNGCWLPENTAAKQAMPPRLRNAVPHSRIHRNGYYFRLDSVINLMNTTSLTELIAALKNVETRLQTSTMPSYVMLSAAELRKLGLA